MKSKSQAVKDWRHRTKQKLIASMGGQCQCCGYNKCNTALELHHIDPAEKEFSMGQIMGHPKSAKQIADEMKKCILVCANCHREIHAGIRVIPTDYIKFNKEIFLVPARTKSKKIPKQRKQKINISNEEILKIWIDNNKNFSLVGRILHVSDNAIRRRLKLTLVHV